MATIQNLRTAIAAYPGIKEASKNTGFRLATFKVGDKGIIAVEKDGIHATFALDARVIPILLTQFRSSAEGISKANTLIGIRIRLNELTIKQLDELVGLAWNNITNK